MAGTAGGSAGSATEPLACRVGEETDAAALFSKLSGTYTFAGRPEACSFAGQMLTAGATYSLSLSSNPPSLKVSEESGAALYSTGFTAGEDLACVGEFVDSLELHDAPGIVRVSFVNEKPSALTLGLCVFMLKKP